MSEQRNIGMRLVGPGFIAHIISMHYDALGGR
jgi:hypothetical protein